MQYHDTISVFVAQNWFKRLEFFNLVDFQSRNFDDLIKDALCSDPPITGKIDEIMEKVVQDTY